MQGLSEPTTSRRLLILSYLGFITIAIPAGALNVAWLYIEADFDLTLGALGVLLTTRSIAPLFVSFNNGAIIARIGIGQFLLLGYIIVAAGLLGFALAPSWNLLLVAGILGGFGGSAIINGLNTFVASNYSSSRVNWLHASFGLGTTIGPLLVVTTVIDMELAWQWSYAIMAIAPIVMAIMVFATCSKWTLLSDMSNLQKQKAKPLGSMRQTLRRPIVWLGVAVFFFATSNELSAGQLTNSLFVEGRGYDAKMVGTWISIYWLTFTVGRLFSGVIVDRVDHSVFLRINMIGTLLGAALMWLNLGQPWSLAGLMIMGFTMAPVAPTLFSDTPKRVGPEQAPHAIGLQSLGANLGLALPPALAGVLAEAIGMEVIGLFIVVVAVITIILFEFLLAYERHTTTIKKRKVESSYRA